jgi:predicted MFS family arabinose efflux permease
MLMVVADAGRLTLLLCIPLTHLITAATPLSLLYAVQAGVSLLSAIFDAAYGACVPQIVAPAHLREANNALQTGRSLSRIVGPVLGGVAIFWMGATNTIFIDVASYTISIASMFAITQSLSTPQEPDRKSFLQDLRLGLSPVWNIKPVRYLMVLTTLTNLVGPGIDVALLYRLQHELRLGAQWAGIIMTGLSGGMFVGSLVNKWVGKHIDVGRWLTISAGLQVFPPIMLAFTQNGIVICLLQVYTGILLVAWNVQSVTLRQTLVPNHLLGRSSSVFRLSAWIFIPLGDAMAGMIGQAYGTRTYFIIAASILIIVSVLCMYVRLDRVLPSTVESVESVESLPSS